MSLLNQKKPRLSPKYSEIYRELRWNISTMIYAPGSLLSENQLSKKFGISRTPIRKILNELEKDNFVETKLGSGTYVTALDHFDFDEIYHLRIGLIQLMEQLSPLSTKKSHLIKLNQINEKIDETEKNIIHLAMISTEIYEFCLNFIGNQPLRVICESLFFHSLRFFVSYVPKECINEEYKKMSDEIKDIIYAVKNNNTQALFAFRKAYLEMSYFSLKKYKKN